jgi:hypothetical protein
MSGLLARLGRLEDRYSVVLAVELARPAIERFRNGTASEADMLVICSDAGFALLSWEEKAEILEALEMLAARDRQPMAAE